MNFTPEQMKAIDVDEGLITASAGSGKTSILVEKYIEELKKGVNVENLLAITFTDKAATEMKDRISRRIDSLFDTTQDMRWWILKNHIPFARISTIHSFCSEVIRENAFFLGLDVDFSIMSEVEKNAFVNILINSSIRDSLDKYERCIRRFGVEKTKELLRQAVEKRYYLDMVDLEKMLGVRYLKALSENEEVVELMEEFIQRAKEIKEAYERFIFEESTFDFEDLLLITRMLFRRHDEIRERYKRRYRYIFVDEFQDTNELQKEIVEAIYEPGVNRIFYVGDEKQSIYRFRGADVSVFIKTKEAFKLENKPVLALSDNFRSHPQIVAFINEIFSNVMKGSEDFAPSYEPMRSRVVYEEKPGGVWLVKTESKEEEADKIARFILYMIERYGDRLREREKSFRNFVILLRQLTNVATIEKALDEYGIPYYTINGRGFYEKMEVKALISFLKLLQDPRDDIALLSILRSPLIFADMDTLFELSERRAFRKDISYMDALKDIDDERIKMFLALYERLHKLKGVLSPSEILNEIMAEFDLTTILSFFRDGDRMIANCEKLLRMVETLEAQDGTLKGVVDYLTAYASPKESEASTETEQANIVRIMSVHQAKGLEFPVVILPQLDAPFRNRGNKIVIENDIPFISELLRKGTTSTFDEFIEREQRKEEEEAKRLLYVAMTRAQDFLALFLPKEDKGIWMKIISKENDLSKNWKECFKEIPFYEKGEREEKKNRGEGETPDLSLTEPIREELDLSVMSVTEFAKYEVEGESVFEDMNGLSELEMDRISDAYRGRLFHQVLERLDNEKGIEDLMEDLKVDRRFTEKDKREAMKMLKGIEDNPIVKMIENASWVESERQFEVEMEGRIFFARIDKYFEYDGQLILVDFKTNEEDKEYEDNQLRHYSRILEKVYGKRVDEGYILYLVKNKSRKVF